MFSKAARFHDGLKPPVNILGVPLLARPHAAYHHHMLLRINAVNDAMATELVLPIYAEAAHIPPDQ